MRAAFCGYIGSSGGGGTVALVLVVLVVVDIVNNFAVYGNINLIISKVSKANL